MLIQILCFWIRIDSCPLDPDLDHWLIRVVYHFILGQEWDLS
jgi:hypothetical protein